MVLGKWASKLTGNFKTHNREKFLRNREFISINREAIIRIFRAQSLALLDKSGIIVEKEL